MIRRKNVILSAMFGSLGLLLNKQETLDPKRNIYIFFKDCNIGWGIYVFNTICILLMLFVNTLSVKYKMLSFKPDGAFIGTTMIFILTYVFLSILDYANDGEIMTRSKMLDAFMIMLGVVLVAMEEQADKIEKGVPSVYQFIADRQTHSDLVEVHLLSAISIDLSPVHRSPRSQDGLENVNNHVEMPDLINKRSEDIVSAKISNGENQNGFTSLSEKALRTRYQQNK